MSAGKSISTEATVVAVKDQVSCTLENEVVILHLQQGLYYGLNEVGAAVWNAVQQPQTVEVLRGLILENFEVSPEQCQRDLMELLQDMAKAGLIEVRNE